jgi:carboxylesterase family protein
MRASASSQQSTPPVCCPCAQAYSDHRFRYNTRYATRYAVKTYHETRPHLSRLLLCRLRSITVAIADRFASVCNHRLRNARRSPLWHSAERSHVSRHSLRPPPTGGQRWRPFSPSKNGRASVRRPPTGRLTLRQKTLRPWHRNEISQRMVFPQPLGEPNAEDKTLVDLMTGYWTQFAKTGNPNGPGLPQWPVHAPKADLVF